MNITKQQWYLKKKGKTKLLGEWESSDFNFKSEVKVSLYIEQLSLQITHLLPKGKKTLLGVEEEQRSGQLQISHSQHVHRIA